MGRREMFTKNELRELLEDAQAVEKTGWRHGHRNTFVFGARGTHWSVVVDIHHEDGWQLDDTIAIEVHPVQKTVTVWEPVP